MRLAQIAYTLPLLTLALTGCGQAAEPDEPAFTAELTAALTDDGYAGHDLEVSLGEGLIAGHAACDAADKRGESIQSAAQRIIDSVADDDDAELRAWHADVVEAAAAHLCPHLVD